MFYSNFIVYLSYWPSNAPVLQFIPPNIRDTRKVWSMKPPIVQNDLINSSEYSSNQAQPQPREDSFLKLVFIRIQVIYFNIVWQPKIWIKGLKYKYQNGFDNSSTFNEIRKKNCHLFTLIYYMFRMLHISFKVFSLLWLGQ